MLKKLLFITALIMSCQSQSKLNESNKEPESLEEISEQLLGSVVKCDNNSSSTYTLCYTKKIENNVKLVEFFIYDVENQKAIYKSKGRNINVSWLNDEEIKFQPLIGVPTGDGTKDFKIYNVISKRESTPNSKP